ncbi:MAG: phytoene/squalene synthase family protein [Rhizobiaceae bacterium]|nr:phytoene/squalene synthase family protein [Rhizobiaceae bacterium]
MTNQPYSSLQALKELDPDRYLACLYLPSGVREHIASLWAFDAEVSRIPGLVSEPMPGEIRIQWWRDLIKSGNNVGSGPLAEKLMETIDAYDLPRETFDNYLQARIFDLYQDPMPDTGSFEGYLGETISILFQHAGTILCEKKRSLLADASGHAGMAIGIARLLAGTARSRAKGQIFLPQDILEKHSLNRETWLADEIFEEHLAALEEMIRIARYHLTFARSVLGQLPRPTRSAFLQLAFVEPVLKEIGNHRLRTFSQPVTLPPLKRNWHLLLASLRQVP